MVDSGKVRADWFVLIACGVFALLMTALTLGAAAPVASGGIVAVFIVLGLAPYGFTALLSLIQPMRRLVVATARAVAVVYGLFDCGLRYLALYHPRGSTDAVVVAVLPFWWVPTVVVVAALTAATLWAASRRTGRPAFA